MVTMKNFAFVTMFLTFHIAYCQKTPDGRGESDSLDNELTFVIVERNPEFPGGISNFFKYISQNVKCPKDAKKAGIKGEVLVKFTISPTGIVLPDSVKIVKGLYPSCDEEALRVIKKSPKWFPGEQQGKGVFVSYKVPVKFE